ncbi:MAG: response regulator, partial [Spirochaetaceae bacterium]|nr:response regulator [Spirochaetaceae bacterium]
MEKQQNIALVDDEPTIVNNIKTALIKEGYSCNGFIHGLQAWEAFQVQMPDLIVLDVMMPQMDGLELCRKIRSINHKVPIVFLSSRDEEIDRILGLEM